MAMQKKPVWVIGIDEVGRGPLAGPVVVCVVAYPYRKYKKNIWKGVTDSKKMTARTREFWYAKREEILNDGAYAISAASAKQIDAKGIAVCIRKCIENNLQKLALDPKEVIVLLDGGLRAPAQYINQKTIIRGDSSEKVIALASVLAKVYRDTYMDTQHKKYEVYNWKKNKGYGTKEHRTVIHAHGITPLHRVSFLSRILNK